MKLIFIGPPGAGKGTQSEKICEKYGISQLSTGDILRQNRKMGTELGKKAQEYMDAGALVPDKIIIDMIKDEIIKPEYANGYILDGFPRTVPQAEALDLLMAEIGHKLNVVLVLEVPREELISRLTARRTCRSCPRTYHLIYSPPSKEGICDNCGGELYQRADDSQETVLNRLLVYENQTKPLVEYYSKQDKSVFVNGMGDIEDISNMLLDILEEYE
jgi:adenylate kinase